MRFIQLTIQFLYPNKPNKFGFPLGVAIQQISKSTLNQ